MRRTSRLAKKKNTWEELPVCIFASSPFFVFKSCLYLPLSCLNFLGHAGQANWTLGILGYRHFKVFTFTNYDCCI